MRKVMVLGGAVALSACATTTAPRLPTTSPTMMTTTGLEAVLGQTAAGLTAMFGDPAQDFRQLGARKLQFTNGSCVLDTYLYPQAAGRDPVVTYIDARNTAGDDVDRVQCVSALKR